MASRSQEPPTTSASAPKGKTKQPVTEETPPKTASKPKSGTTKSTTAKPAAAAAPAPKSRTSKTAKEEKPSATAAAPKSRSTKTPTPAESEATPDVAEAKMALPDDMRAQWIAEAAYFIAERRGFSPGSPEDDWREAETLIDRMLAATRH